MRSRTKIPIKENFITLFTKNCFLNNYSKVPFLKVLSVNPILSGKWTTYRSLEHEINVENPVTVYIAYENYEKDGQVKQLFVKNQTLDSTFLYSLHETSETFNTLTTLRLEYCDLKEMEIESLQNIMSVFPNINDLNIDGNPNADQNFDLLLNGSNLEFLSLARCEIDAFGLKRLSYRLSDENIKLRSINLSGNHIKDSGVAHLANALRSNRSLLSLNLAFNHIKNKGCKILLTSLQSFYLTAEEIMLRKKSKIAYLKERHALMKQYELEQSRSKFKSVELPKKNFNRNKYFKHGSTSSTESSKSLVRRRATVESYLEKHLIKPSHPFVSDSVEDGSKICCNGNLKLSHLNLAYNDIGRPSYIEMINVLKYQTRTRKESTGSGILQLDLVGNTNENCAEVNEIKALLSSDNSTKKWSTSKSTI